MFKRHKAAIIVFLFLIMIIIISGINLYLMLENANTRNDRVRQSVESVLETIEAKKVTTPTQTVIIDNTPVKGVDYFDGRDGQNGTDGVNGESIKGDTGAPGKDGVNGKDGKDGNDALPIIVRCNTKKNRWETKYAGDSVWQVMNDEVIKCTIEEE